MALSETRYVKTYNTCLQLDETDTLNKEEYTEFDKKMQNRLKEHIDEFEVLQKQNENILSQHSYRLNEHTDTLDKN